MQVLVVGGGVVGAGVALDAVSRGLSVGLVEARDFSSGTSSRSSKLIHGGLRYLEQLNVGLVREALSERSLLLQRLAPHLVRPVSFLFPLTHCVWERGYVGAGLSAYDFLGLAIGQTRGLPAHRQLTRQGALRLAPTLKRSALTGALLYWDAQVDDARYVVTLLRTAAGFGAHLASRTQVTGFLREGARVTGVRATDLETGTQLEIRAQQVVNATGVWTDEIQAMIGGRGGINIRVSKGVHLVVPRDRIRSSTGIILRTPGSVLFVMPWGRHWIIGTTDTGWSLDQAHPAASRADIDYVLSQLNRFLAVPLTWDDVEGVYAGLRPLLAGDPEQTSKLPLGRPVALTVGHDSATRRDATRANAPRRSRQRRRVRRGLWRRPQACTIRESAITPTLRKPLRVDTGSTEISRVASLLAESESSAFARALLRASETGWEVSHASVAVTPDSPPGWIEQTWRYNHLVFVASAVPVKELANLCSPGGGAILLGGIEATVPAPQHLSQWTRRPSFGRHDPVVLPWPTVEFIVHRAIQNQEQIPSETLTGESAPSFPEPQSAWRAFFSGNFSLTGAHGLPNELGLIRMADTKGWLGEVHVTPTQLTVQVHGNELAGVRLELFGATDRAEQSVTGQGTAVFPLQRGLPPDAWLWLKRGTEWLDYRSIDARSNWSSDLKRAGVTIEIPSDPQANVQALLAAGEGPQVEFKRELPETAELKRKHFKTVAAFANGDGGDMVFGMDPDELTVVGLGKEDPKTLRDHLYALIHRTVVPSPSVLVEDHQVNDKTILVLHVEPGAAPPYGLAVDKSTRDKPDYFVRRGSSTYPAQPGELREAARRRPPMHTTVR